MINGNSAPSIIIHEQAVELAAALSVDGLEDVMDLVGRIPTNHGDSRPMGSRGVFGGSLAVGSGLLETSGDFNILFYPIF